MNPPYERTDRQIATLPNEFVSGRQTDKLEQNAEFFLLSLSNLENNNKVLLWRFIYNYESYELLLEIIIDHSTLVQTSVKD